MEDLRTYCKNVLKLGYTHPSKFNALDIIRYYGSWKRSLEEKKSPLKDELPWIPFAAINFFESILTKDMRVFEYGSGGSTLFFARRVKQVVSVEHDAEWAERVNQVIKTKGYGNSSVCLIEPIFDLDNYRSKTTRDIDGYVSGFRRHAGDSFESYVKCIDEYPDSYFDLVFIDGRARVSCAHHAIAKIKAKGFIVLDNSERRWYSIVDELLEKKAWKRKDFFGPSPYRTVFHQISFWRKK